MGVGGVHPSPPASISSAPPTHEARSDFMFFVLAPREIMVARPRDAADRIDWLLAAKHFDEALEV
jgi:hypothetical protein